MILVYHGLRGSGWVIAYARHVLGLPVCVLKSTSAPVPISGDYQSARVLIYLFEAENKCEILLNRSVHDFFVTESLDSSGHAGWLVDVEKTNVLDSYISSTDPLRKGASTIAYSMADTYIQRLAENFCATSVAFTGKPEDEELANAGLIRYPVYCLPALRKRVRRILLLLGFELNEGSNPQSNDWSEYLSIRGRSLDELRAGPAWIQSGLGHVKVSDPGQRVEDSPDADCANSRAGNDDQSRISTPAPAVHQPLEFNEIGVKHMAFLFRAVEAACWLAFTDWDQYLRLLSTTFLESTASWQRSLVYKKPLIGILMRALLGSASTYKHPGDIIDLTELKHPGDIIDMTDLCATAIDICVGGQQTWTPNFSEEKMLAFRHWGIIYVHNAALHQTLDLQSCFVHLLPGAIIANGARQKNIYTYSTHQKTTRIITSSNDYTDSQFTPVNLFPNISFSSRLEISGDDVILQQNALVKDQICDIASPGYTSQALARLYVTKECDHLYYGAYDTKNTTFSLGNGKIEQGLFVAGTGDQTENGLWLQAVDQNAPGQWLAYQNQDDGETISVLQRGCCIACAHKMLKEAFNGRYIRLFRGGRIIHGRFPGEDME